MAETATQKRAAAKKVAESAPVEAAPEVAAPDGEAAPVPAPPVEAEAIPDATPAVTPEVPAEPVPAPPVEVTAPVQAVGPGSGNRVVTDSGEDIASFDDAIDSTAETIVTMSRDVYEVHAAPGAPNRTVKRLLFHKGQQVPKSVLDRHAKALAANQTEVDRLKGLEGVRAAEVDAERAARAAQVGSGETKEHGSVVESKEGGGVPRRS